MVKVKSDKELKNTVNYQKRMEEVIGELAGRKPLLLLHSCCGPCSTSVIESLFPYFKLMVYFYNPNIFPEEEYLWRKEELKNYIKLLEIPMIEGDYAMDDYFKRVKGMENEPEGGLRCRECFQMRLQATGERALSLEAEFFTTTLSVSRHKNSRAINEIGYSVEASLDGKVRYLPGDFKKSNGYLRSITLSRQAGMRRQDYCGCLYSKKERENKE